MSKLLLVLLALPAIAFAVSCTINTATGETCPISKLTVNASNLITPGGLTKCIKHNSGPFQFQVVPRDLTKVHIYFQGGGACWDKVTTWVPACSTKASPEGINSGIFDATDARNPYRDYTVVAILYCSGDVHIGNVTQPYEDEPNSGYNVTQFGAINTRATLDWIKSQGLGSNALLVSGSSAGALGAQTWASAIVSEFPSKFPQVIIDSYAGVLPCQGPIIHHWGVCNTGVAATFPSYLLRKCNEKSLDVYDIMPSSFTAHPGVAYAFIQSKYDKVQREYEEGVAVTCLDDPILTDSDFYAWTNELFEIYLPWSNFQVFFVDADHHVYLTSSVMYTATTTGTNGINGGPKLIDFLSSVASGGSIKSQCNGGPLNRNQFTGTDYCDNLVFPRTFTPF